MQSISDIVLTVNGVVVDKVWYKLKKFKSADTDIEWCIDIEVFIPEKYKSEIPNTDVWDTITDYIENLEKISGVDLLDLSIGHAHEKTKKFKYGNMHDLSADMKACFNL